MGTDHQVVLSLGDIREVYPDDLSRLLQPLGCGAGLYGNTATIGTEQVR